MQVRVLGPLDVVDGDRRVPLGGPKERAVLAVLALHANQVVSEVRLIDALWGEDPPRTATKTLQNYVKRLRQALADHGRDIVIEHRAPGYVLRVPRDGLDLERAERCLTIARDAADRGDHASAARLLRESLDLWRGRPLEEFAGKEFAIGEIARLEELHQCALEERVQAELALGRHTDCVPDLEAFVARHPYRERLWGQLMLALYRSGRQADALRVFQRARTQLVDELGLEPGAELRRLERSIIGQDPALDWTATRSDATEPSPAPTPEVPAPAADRRWRPGRLIVLAVATVVAVAGVTAGLIAWHRPETVTLSSTGVARLSEKSNKVVGAVRFGTRPTAIAVGAGGVWVLDSADATMSRLDPNNGRVAATIGTNGSPVAIAVGERAVWVVDGFDGVIQRVDPSTNRLTAAVDAGVGLRAVVAVGSQAVWVTNGITGTVLRVDTATNAVAATIDTGGRPGAVAFGAGALWVADERGGTLVRIDPARNQVVARIGLGFTPGALAADDHGVWVVNHAGSTVVRVDPSRGEVVTTINVGRQPAGVAVGSRSVWVSSSLDATVSRIDPSANVVVATIRLRHAVAGVAIADARVWLALPDG